MQNKKAYNKAYFQEHKEHYREINDAYMHRLQRRETTFLNRIKVLSFYSNPHGTPVCNNCGIQDIDVLCIDHIDGGGRKQLRETKSKGSSFHYWLSRNNFPEGYQILCANCNTRKAKFEQVERRRVKTGS